VVNVISEVIASIDKHEEWRGKNCLNLIASENVMSPLVRSALSSDLGHRYTSRDRFYRGTHFTDEIEERGEELAKQVFGAETADLRPLSGHIADLTILALAAKPNDILMCVSADDGGYPGIWEQGAPSFLQLEVIGFPFSKENRNIDAEKAAELIREKKPRVIVFGASLFLFPHPVKSIAEVAREIDAHVTYDGSHVLGLIAGKEFQAPLEEGATMLFGSTHKSFFGPQGGIILADKEHGEAIKKNIYPAFVDNAHWNRIAALTLALAEMKEFGKKYAKQVVKNTQALAKALADCNFPVAGSKLGFTRSHQILLDFGDYKKVRTKMPASFQKPRRKGRVVAKTLEQANIIVDCVVRLGTCELTRRGMKQKEMFKIAEFINRVLNSREKPQRVRKEVREFMSEFQEVEFCFK
jgi:glycine hydroxymethyltransferase